MNTSDTGSLTVTETSGPSYEEILLELRELKDRVKQLTVEEIVKEVQLPIEVIKPIVEKNFKLGRPPLESEIRHAISQTKTMSEAAEYLGVYPTTLRTYCELYDGHKNIVDGGPTPPSPMVEPLWKPTRGRKAIKRSKSILP